MAEKAKKEVATPEVEATQTENEATATQEVQAQDPQEFLANFDWHKYEEGIGAVDEKKIKSFW